MPEIITINIDGKEVRAKEGETVLEAALRDDIDIPNLCYNKKVSHTAACRLCVVKIEGFRGLAPSCTTPVKEWMDVSAFDDEIEAVRETTLELALSNPNDDGISCLQEGECRLQDLAFRYSLGKQDRTFPPIWQDIEKTSDASSQVVNYDASTVAGLPTTPGSGAITHSIEELENEDVILVRGSNTNETCEMADVVFPAASFAEKNGHFTNTERRILPMKPLVPQIGESKPDWQVVQEIACAMGSDGCYDSTRDIIDEINAVTPQYGGITWKRIEQGERLQWPCPNTDHPGTRFLHKDKFVRGRGLFSPVEHIHAYPVHPPLYHPWCIWCKK